MDFIDIHMIRMPKRKMKDIMAIDCMAKPRQRERTPGAKLAQ